MKCSWSKPYCNMTYITYCGAKRLPLHIHVSVQYFEDGSGKAQFLNLHLNKDKGESNFSKPTHEFIGEYEEAKLKAEQWVNTLYGGN